MPGLLTNVDPHGLLEYSVVYTDRALNHMSQNFQSVMCDISKTLKSVYNASAVAVVPGSGTFGMEAVARQLATDKKCLIIRNGWFSYRWTQILEMGKITSDHHALIAQAVDSSDEPAFVPCDLAEVVKTIESEKPDVVFAPHVETSSGMILPDNYIREVGAAVHRVGGIFVLDCIASGTIWVDMKDLGVDILISAPQKGWSGSPCCGLVMMNERALDLVKQTQSSSFACDLGKWLQIMEAYEKGGHAYHATMPTDALTRFREVMQETESMDLQNAREKQQLLGDKVRALLRTHGFKSVAAAGYEAPGVVVCYTDDPEIQNGKKFRESGVQIAAGVPLKCDEPADFQTFRIGLFGLDKLKDVDAAVSRFDRALQRVVG